MTDTQMRTADQWVASWQGFAAHNTAMWAMVDAMNTWDWLKKWADWVFSDDNDMSIAWEVLDELCTIDRARRSTN